MHLAFVIGKASVVRRHFPLAQLLLSEALLYTQDVFGKHHLKYADCLVDYAFYLLNVDEVAKSVQAYEEALKVRLNICKVIINHIVPQFFPGRSEKTCLATTTS